MLEKARQDLVDLFENGDLEPVIDFNELHIQEKTPYNWVGFDHTYVDNISRIARDVERRCKKTD